MKTVHGIAARRSFPLFTSICLALAHLVTLSPCHLDILSAAEPDPPRFHLQTAGGVTASGLLQELGAQWRVRLGGEKPVHTEADDLIELRRVGGQLPELPAEEQLLFVNGDRLPGSVVRLGGERVHFRPHLMGKAAEEKAVTLPVSALAVLWLAAPDGADRADQLRRRLLTGNRTRDVVYLRNGDVVEGAVVGMDDKVLQIEVDRKITDIKRERVAVIAFSTELTTSLRPKGAYGRLVLANGARLSLASAVCTDGKTLTGVTLFEAPIRVALDEVAALYLYQGKAVYLSDLKPRHYEHTPYGDERHPLVNDGNVAGHDLRVGGSTYDRGLGLHSASRVSYDLGGNYRRFEALVGLDDRHGKRGSVRIRVLVDGKPQDLGPDRELTLRSGPLPIRVDVTGAKELTLVVEFGQGGPVDDLVNWADARLIRK